MSGGLWRRLPVDGQGLRMPVDPDLAGLRCWAAKRFWRRVPWWGRPGMVALARLLWIAAALFRVWRFARRQRLSWRDALTTSDDCMASGANPNESWVWRRLFADAPHPLPGRAAGMLLAQLGCRKQHDLLADKLAAAELLASAGLPVPPVLALIPVGQTLEIEAANGRFIKPRRGAAGREARAIHSPQTISAITDDLLVQPLIQAAAELTDLAEGGAAPVLRLTTARRPGEAPFLHSAFLAVAVPEQSPRHFIAGHMRVPIDPATGCMGLGLWFLQAEQRFARLPWNGALLHGRSVPDFAQAVDMALRAMSLLPALPLINWDMIPTGTGPVFLEGNSGGDWILTRLCATQGLETAPLVPLLRQWQEQEG